MQSNHDLQKKCHENCCNSDQETPPLTTKQQCSARGAVCILVGIGFSGRFGGRHGRCHSALTHTRRCRGCPRSGTGGVVIDRGGICRIAEFSVRIAAFLIRFKKKLLPQNFNGHPFWFVICSVGTFGGRRFDAGVPLCCGGGCRCCWLGLPHGCDCGGGQRR